MALTDLSVIRDLCARYDFSLSKGFGQNFIINPGVCPRIAEASGIGPGWGALEIGPGIGVLTEQLAERADKVVSVEVDTRLQPLLAETMAGHPNFKLVLGDVLKVDLAALLKAEFPGMPVAVCANLPYYITSPILMRLLEQAPPQLRRIVVMVQREVAVRLCAPSGSPEGGAISLAVEYRSLPRILFRVPPGCFMPAPKVESAVVRMDLRTSPAVSCSNPDAMFRLIRQGFGQRRKTLVNALGNQGPFSKALLGDALDALHLARDIRAERMTLSQFAALTDFLLNHACPDGGAVL